MGWRQTEPLQQRPLGKEPETDSEGCMGPAGQRHGGWRELGKFPKCMAGRGGAGRGGVAAGCLTEGHSATWWDTAAVPREAGELATGRCTQALSQQEQRLTQGQNEGLTGRPEGSWEGTASHSHAVGRWRDRNSSGWPTARGSGRLWVAQLLTGCCPRRRPRRPGPRRPVLPTS